MGDVIFADFRNGSRQYTKGAGLDDLVRLVGCARPVEPVHYHDTAPNGYVAPEKDPA